MRLTPLFKKAKNGSIRVWVMEVIGNQYRTEEGQVGGKMSTTKWTTCYGKNIGKSNETTDEQQAESEALAKWVYRKEQGAVDDIADVHKASAFPQCMLAEDVEDYKDSVVFPCSMQPKLDGKRARVYRKEGKVISTSRFGKLITTMPHVLEALTPLLDKYPDMILDGEMYNHKFCKDFEGLISLSSRSVGASAKDKARATKHLQYHIYDADIPDTAFLRRSITLRSRLRIDLDDTEFDGVQVVETKTAHSWADVWAYEEECVSAGYEGIMLRDNQSLYHHFRTSALLKVKRFEDNEYELLAVEEGAGDRQGLATRAVLKCSHGEFAAGVMGNEAYARRLLKQFKYNPNKKVMATVKHQGFTKHGKPRIGKLKIIRDYE